MNKFLDRTIKRIGFFGDYKRNSYCYQKERVVGRKGRKLFAQTCISEEVIDGLMLQFGMMPEDIRKNFDKDLDDKINFLKVIDGVKIE